MRENQALALAILGQQTNAPADGVSRIADSHRFAINEDLARFEAISAKNETHGFRATGAGQSGQSEDFATTR